MDCRDCGEPIEGVQINRGGTFICRPCERDERQIELVHNTLRELCNRLNVEIRPEHQTHETWFIQLYFQPDGKANFDWDMK